MEIVKEALYLTLQRLTMIYILFWMIAFAERCLT